MPKHRKRKTLVYKVSKVSKRTPPGEYEAAITSIKKVRGQTVVTIKLL